MADEDRAACGCGQHRIDRRSGVVGFDAHVHGLERRRAAEAELFMSETPPQAGRGMTGVPKSLRLDSMVVSAPWFSGKKRVMLDTYWNLT